MIAIDTIRLTLATMRGEARPSPAPAAPRSCASASARRARTRGVGSRARRHVAMRAASASACRSAAARSPCSRRAAGRRPAAAARAARRRRAARAPADARRSGAAPSCSSPAFSAAPARARRLARGTPAAGDGGRDAERRRTASAIRLDCDRRRDAAERSRRRGRRRTRAAPAPPSAMPEREPEQRCRRADQRALRRRAGAEQAPRVSRSTRSNANCARRATTDSACVENTSKPPVNSATSASTLRLTRYARDRRRGVRAPTASGVDRRHPAAAAPRVAARNVLRRRRRVAAAGRCGSGARAVEALLRGGDVHDGDSAAGTRAGSRPATLQRARRASPTCSDERVAGLQPRSDRAAAGLERNTLSAEQRVRARSAGVAEQRRLTACPRETRRRRRCAARSSRPASMPRIDFDLDDGLATATSGIARERRDTAPRRSRRAARALRGRQSPESVATLPANSSTAAALMSCTAKPSATPSAIASTAAPACARCAASAPPDRSRQQRHARCLRASRIVAMSRAGRPRSSIEHAIGARPRRPGMRDEHAGRAVAFESARAAAAARCRRAVRIEIAGRLVGQHQRRPCTSARAIATRCSSPPDSSRGMLAPRSPSPTAASIAATRASRSSRRDRRAAPAAARRSARRVRYGSTWNAWNTKPMRRAPQQRARVVVERREVDAVDATRPASGRSRPAIRLSSVDLPTPDSPMIATYSPLPDVERKLVQDGPVTVALRQPVDLQHRVDSTDRVAVCGPVGPGVRGYNRGPCPHIASPR